MNVFVHWREKVIWTIIPAGIDGKNSFRHLKKSFKFKISKSACSFLNWFNCMRHENQWKWFLCTIMFPGLICSKIVGNVKQKLWSLFLNICSFGFFHLFMLIVTHLSWHDGANRNRYQTSWVVFAVRLQRRSVETEKKHISLLLETRIVERIKYPP